MSKPFRPIRAGVVAVAVAVAVGCGPAPSPAPSPEPTLHPLVEYDLCPRVDLRPLHELSFTIWDVTPTELGVAGGTGGACSFGMRAADGASASLTVRSAAIETTSYARSIYDGEEGLLLMNMLFAGNVTGVGDAAAAFELVSEDEFGNRLVEYVAVARSSNLIVKVELGVGGEEVTPEDLAQPVGTVLERVVAASPPGSPPVMARPVRGMAYDHTGLDLCAGTDQSVLVAELPVAPDPEPREGASSLWAECTFRLAATGAPSVRRYAVLNVRARAFDSIVAAEDDFERFQSSRPGRGGWSDADSVGGLGDRAYATAWNYGSGVVEFEYLIGALAGNLVVTVRLYVSGTDPPKQTMADLVQTITADTISLVPLESRP